MSSLSDREKERKSKEIGEEIDIGFVHGGDPSWQKPGAIITDSRLRKESIEGKSKKE